jgi:hypothetical protein
MGVRGTYIAQEQHVVNLIPPVSAAGGVTSGVVNLKNFEHATIILQFGVTSAAPKDVLVLASDNGSPEATAAIAFNLHKCETAYNAANGDVLGAKVAATTAGFIPPATDNIFYVIEVDAASLPSGKPYVKLQIEDNSPAASSILASAVAILSGARYGHDQGETVLT